MWKFAVTVLAVAVAVAPAAAQEKGGRDDAIRKLEKEVAQLRSELQQLKAQKTGPDRSADRGPDRQRRTEPIAARIAWQIEALDEVQIGQRRTEPTVARIAWQIGGQDVVLIVQQRIVVIAARIERPIVDQIAALVQIDLLVVVQADRDSALVDMVDLIVAPTSAVILAVANSVEGSLVVGMDTGVAGQILACSLRDRWGPVLIEAATVLNLDVACKDLAASAVHSSVPVLKVVAPALIDQHHLHHHVVANVTMIGSPHASEMMETVGHHSFFSCN